MGNVDYEAIEDFLEEAFPERGYTLHQTRSRIRTFYGTMEGWDVFSRGKSYRLIYKDDNTRIFLMLDGYIVIINEEYTDVFLDSDFYSRYAEDGYILDSMEVVNIFEKIVKINNRKIIEVK